MRADHFIRAIRGPQVFCIFRVTSRQISGCYIRERPEMTSQKRTRRVPFEEEMDVPVGDADNPESEIRNQPSRLQRVAAFFRSALTTP